MLYFSAVHATTISSDAIDHLLSLERHVTPEVAPRTDVLAFDVAQAERCPATAWGLPVPVCCSAAQAAGESNDQPGRRMDNTDHAGHQ